MQRVDNNKTRHGLDKLLYQGVSKEDQVSPALFLYKQICFMTGKGKIKWNTIIRAYH